jgi:Putative transmembrane protein (PGPGW)
MRWRRRMPDPRQHAGWRPQVQIVDGPQRRTRGLVRRVPRSAPVEALGAAVAPGGRPRADEQETHRVQPWSNVTCNPPDVQGNRLASRSVANTWPPAVLRDDRAKSGMHERTNTRRLLPFRGGMTHVVHPRGSRQKRTYWPSWVEHLCDSRSMLSKSLFIVGAALIVLGLIMIPLPGPGFLVISLGVPVLLSGVVVSAASRSRRRSRP